MTYNVILTKKPNITSLKFCSDSFQHTFASETVIPKKHTLIPKIKNNLYVYIISFILVKKTNNKLIINIIV